MVEKIIQFSKFHDVSEVIVFLYTVRRGGHCIEQNVVSTLSFPRRLQTTNNSISLSSTQFPFGRRARSTQPATIICAAALVMFFTLFS